jgi:hypothetical protein
MANIFVSVPILGRPHARMMDSLYRAAQNCKEHNIIIHLSENDSMISRVRNVHISTFYNDYPDCEYFVSIDSDLEIVNKYSSNNIFTKLVEHDAKFVGGLYALKRDDEVRCSSVPMDRSTVPDLNSGLKNMLWMSTGCWCLKREAVTKMIEAHPELTYDGDDNMSGKKVYGLYVPMFKEFTIEGKEVKKYLSEDWSFCERWRNLGGQIFADTGIVLNHFGEKPYKLWNVEIVVKQRDENKPDEEVTPPEVDTALPEAGFELG